MFVDLSLYLIEDVHDKYFIENALIESFAIHLRNILDFLYSDSARKDDIIAEHFFTDPHIWRNARPQKSAKLDAMHHRVHKEIAHLTYTRQKVTPETKPWPIAEIVSEVMPAFKRFLQLVPPKLLGSRWDGHK